MKLPLPDETRNYFGNDKNRVLKISNLGLLFNKYVYSWQNGWQMEEKNSREFRDDISKIPFDKKYPVSVYSRQKAIIQGLQGSGWHVEVLELVTNSRLIIGLGGTSVIETGITLHPLYGFPYLPASGLKGLARAYAEIGCDAEGQELLDVFGSEDKARHSDNNRQGEVFFMDGLPTSFPKLELDIMNPHYSRYYQGEKDSKGNPMPPADYLNPVPVTFLAVAPGQTFSFCLYSREKALAEKAKEWLIGGLTDLGAGGKTNVGYGYFKVNELNTQESKDAAQPAPTAGQTIVVASETVVWENATLTWSPGNQILKAIKSNSKAELKLSEKSIVPVELHEQLFVKRKPVTANVTVEKIGNAYKITQIS